MTPDTKNLTAADIDSTSDNWQPLTDSDRPDEGATTFYKAEGAFIRATVEDDTHSITGTGTDITASPAFDRDAIDANLAAKYGEHLDADDRAAILDWYDAFVTELVELDLHDPTYTITYEDGYAVLEGMEHVGLTDELESVLGDHETDLPARIATDVNDWWSPEDTSLDDDYAYAATLNLQS